MAKTRVAINGMGRIGRLVLRALWDAPDFEVVAVNDIAPACGIAYLLAHSSEYGAFPARIELDGNALCVGGQRIVILQEVVAENLPWGELGVDLVLDCSGAYNNHEASFRPCSSLFVTVCLELTMQSTDSLRAEEVAKMLHIGKNAVYELAKSGDLKSFKIGRRLRFTHRDVQDYIASSRQNTDAALATKFTPDIQPQDFPFVICGQDVILDLLSNYLTQAGVYALRSYVGSYDALTALYKDEVQVATAHLWDGDTGEYNVPYVKRLLPGVASVVVNIVYRTQGFYVAKKNPKNIKSWEDLAKEGIVLVNREKGAGSRILLDEHLRLLEISPQDIAGYENEVQSHIAVASAVARGRADVAIGSEKVAKQVEGIDFIPLQQERYDLVVKRDGFDTLPVRKLMGILESGLLKAEVSGLGGYDTKDMGRIMWMG